nr:PAS domain S-box protein [uncultured Desulfobulbus sp.]
MQLDTSKRFEKSIIWGTVFIDLLLVVGALFFLFHSRTHYLESLEVTGHNLVQLLEQRIADKARLVDGAALRIAREVELQLQGGQTDSADMRRQLRLEMDALPEVDSVRVSNSQGLLIWGEGLEEGEPVSITNFSYFQAHQKHRASEPIVSSVIHDPVTGQWVVAFTRCYHQQDGSFGGLVIVAVPLDVFFRVLSNPNFGASGTAALRYTDGSLVTRVPTLEGPAGKPGSQQTCQAYRELLERNVPVGNYTTEASPEAVVRFCSYRRVMGWPFTITVGLVEHEYLEPWHMQASLGMLLLGVLLLATTALAWITLRHLHAQSIRETERDDDLARRRLLIDQSRDGIVILDNQGKVYEANRSFANMLGYSPEEIQNLHVWDWDVHWSQDELLAMVNQIDLRGDRLATKHRRKNGQIIEVEISTNGAEFDGNKLVFCVCRDVSERNQAREALKTSEEKYRVIFENQIFAVAVFDLVTLRFLDVNDTYLRLYGYSRSELLGGMTIVDVSMDKEETRQTVERAVDEGGIFIPLCNHRKKDGSIVPVEIVGGPFKWDGREVMFSLSRDISVRKQAEDELREREELYRHLITSLRDGFFACDAQSIVTYVNAPLVKMLGAHKEHDLLGRSIFDFVAPIDLERVKQHFAEAVENRTLPLTLELELVCEGGRALWAEVKPTMIARARGGLSIQGLIVDITKRRQAAEALKKSEERLNLALQASKDALWDWDRGTDLLYCSPRWFSMVGYTPEELDLNEDLWMGLVHPDDTERAQRELEEAFKNRETFEVHVRLRHKDGTYLPVLTRGTVQRDARGEVIRLAGINTDLSEQKQMEEERREWERQAQQLQKAESLSRMAGAIAHHFNNLLSVVIGNIEMSLEDLPDDAPSVPSLRAATRAAERAVEVSGLLLTYLGQTEGRRQLLDLGALYRKALPQLRALVQKGVVLQTHFTQVGPVVSGNARHLNRMLKNLLVNAAEALGQEQGHINISMYLVGPTDIADQHRFPVDWDPTALEYVCVQVEDTGVGIDLFDIEQLFDPFFSSKFTGRGLGLPVVMGIVRSHGGGITVQSSPGNGSVFQVYLPVAVEEPLVARQDEYDTTSLEGGKILLIEDEEQIRLMTRTMLSRLGYDCICASDGGEALQLFQEHATEIFLAICDLTMPTMGGWEIMAALQEMAPNLPFILTSGYDESQVMASGRQAYPQVFLQKPYKKSALGVAIDTALQ